MWTRQSHMLAPLIKLTSINRKTKWEKVKQDAFNKINRILARDNLVTYLGFNETFKIHTDASTFQLGGVISQKGRPIVLLIR